MKQVSAKQGEGEIKVVGQSGQISLGKRYAGKMLRLERFGDGRIVLTAIRMVPESQFWTLEEPHRSRIQRGLAWAAQTKPHETDPSALLKHLPEKVRRARARQR